MKLNNAIKSKMETSAAQNIAGTIPRTNILRYSIVRQVLSGNVGGKNCGPFEAQSGAGQDGVHKTSVKFKDWHPGKAKTSDAEGMRGGAIMPGWWLVIPEKLAKKEQSSHVAWGAAPTAMSLRIVPYKLDQSTSKSTRNSFYIHGNGGKGSDGCILLGPVQRQALVELVCNMGERGSMRMYQAPS